MREAVDISGDVVDDDYADGRRLGLPAATDDPAYHAIVMQVSLPDPGEPGAALYAVDDVCPSEYLFDGDSKGFEGATSLRGSRRPLWEAASTSSKTNWKLSLLPKLVQICLRWFTLFLIGMTVDEALKQLKFIPQNKSKPFLAKRLVLTCLKLFKLA